MLVADQLRSSRVALVGAAAVVTGLVIAGVIALSEGGETVPQRHAEHANPLYADPGVIHVHGLGVDPADGTLFAATHSGVFELPALNGAGPAQRVADRQQDTMAFTVTGPRTFLASGHPDVAATYRPPLMGLIESRDRAQSWQTLSLQAKADFHVLRVAHGRVYGYDSTSGSLLVTADRRNWDRRSGVELLDFVVSPADADELVGTTPDGTVRSSDGGRTWQRDVDAPPLVRLDWSRRGLLGVGADGQVYATSDLRSAWAGRGSAGGFPAALFVDGDQGAVYVAVQDGAIMVSRDGGDTFSVRYQEQD